LLAIFPLRYLPAQKDVISVDILKTVFALAPKAEGKSYLALFGISITDITFMLFWPMFIFPIMSGFVGVGFVGSLVAFIAMITTIIVGYLIDRYGPKRVIKILAPIDAMIWVLKSLITVPIHVYLASGSSAVTRSAQTITLDSSIYQRARHEDIVAFIVQREVGISVGRFVYLLIMGILFWYNLPLMIAFVFAAPAALLTVLYPYETQKDLLQNPDADVISEVKEVVEKITHPAKV
jgi:MFS family permease